MNVMNHLIQSIRHQMQALDQTLEILEKQLNTASVRTAPADDTVRCPACSTILLDANQYDAMGIGTCYACPSCEFRGPVC